MQPIQHKPLQLLFTCTLSALELKDFNIFQGNRVSQSKTIKMKGCRRQKIQFGHRGVAVGGRRELIWSKGKKAEDNNLVPRVGGRRDQFDPHIGGRRDHLVYQSVQSITIDTAVMV